MTTSKFESWNRHCFQTTQIKKITEEFEDSDLDDMVHAIMAIKHNRIYGKSAKSMTTIKEQVDNLINSLENSKDIEYINCHKSNVESKLKSLIESVDSYKTAQKLVKDHPDRI